MSPEHITGFAQCKALWSLKGLAGYPGTIYQGIARSGTQLGCSKIWARVLIKTGQTVLGMRMRLLYPRLPFGSKKMQQEITSRKPMKEQALKHKSVHVSQAFSSDPCISLQQSRQCRQQSRTVRCEAAASTAASGKKGNEFLFAAVEMLFKVPPLFNMAVRQVCSPFVSGAYAPTHVSCTSVILRLSCTWSLQSPLKS